MFCEGANFLLKDKFMILRKQEPWMLEMELSAVSRNFREHNAQSGKSVQTFFPPTVEEVLDNYLQDPELRKKIDQMLDADAVKRIYAAVLLWNVDQPKAKDVLVKLSNDETRIEIQTGAGFSIIETTIGILARDYLSEQQIRGSNFSREETLNKWAVAISMEKRHLNQVFDEESLPKWKDVLEARENVDQLEKLRIDIDRLRNGDGVAEKFYAASLLQTIDEAESRKVLESLLTEKTKVGILSGDEMDNIPAYQVAEGMLNPERFNRTSEPANPIARATKWLEKNFFSKNSDD